MPNNRCGGDCNGDSTVTVDELIRLVNITLGHAVEGCDAGDVDGDGLVTITDIIRAVDNSLDGCLPIITIGTAEGQPGDTVGVTIELNANGQSVAGIATLSVIFDPAAVALVTCSSSVPGRTAMVTPEVPGLALITLTGGMTTLPNGAVLNCQLVIQSSSSLGRHRIEFRSAQVLDPGLNLLDATGSSGAVNVVAARPTATESRTEVPTPGPSATSTQAAASPTRTPVNLPTQSPTATPSPSRTPTATQALLPTPTRTPTLTATQTLTPTRTLTETPTVSPTPTLTPSPGVMFINFGFAGVVNELDHNVSFISSESSGAGTGAAAVSNTVAVSGVPRHIALTPGGRLAFVTTRSPDEVAVIDPAERRVVATLSGLGALPEAVASTPDGRSILVTNFGSDSVSVIDVPALDRRLASRAPRVARLTAADVAADAGTGAIPVGVEPNSVAVTVANAYVTNFGSHSVSVIDTQSKSMLTTVDVGANPNSVVVSPDGAFAYVADYSSMTISVIRTDTNEVTTTIPVNLFAQARPTGLGFSPDGGLLYLTMFSLADDLFGSVFVIDPSLIGNPKQSALVACLEFGNSSPCPNRCQCFPDMVGVLPTAVQVSPAGDSALVSSFLVQHDNTAQLVAKAAGGSVLMIDTATNEMVDTVPVGDFPVSLAAAAGTARPAPSQTPTPTTNPALTATPTATPTSGEQCGQIVCTAPNVCVRDLGCHRNGCVPHDKCCPAAQQDCLACKGGGNDGAACNASDDCPGGTCVQ